MLTMPDGIPLPLRDDYSFKSTSPIVHSTFVIGRARKPVPKPERAGLTGSYVPSRARSV